MGPSALYILLVSEIMLRGFSALSHSLSSHSFSRIYACIEESIKGTSTGECTLQFRGLDIRNVEPGIMGLGRSDPFLQVSRKNADHAAGVVRWYVLLFDCVYLYDFFILLRLLNDVR